MQKVIKNILLSFILFIAWFSFSLPCLALNKTSDYLDIDNINSFTTDTLEFSQLEYIDNTSDSSLSLGIKGITINNQGTNVNYELILTFYDDNYLLLGNFTYNKIALEGTNVFYQMINKNSLSNYENIAYYKIEININEEIEVTNNTPSQNSLYKNLDYVIDNYKINIKVNQNNTLDIEEEITAYFNINKHGIIRTIPVYNEVTRLDGTKEKNKAVLSNLSVDNKYTLKKEKGNYKIQIGDENRTITGSQTYKIKYTYNLGKDHAKNYDELYFNLIGNEWDTVIGNITFNISMPSSFDASKLGFASGLKGSTNNSDVRYNVVGNNIIGSYEGILKENEGLTVRCELEEGYFANANLPLNLENYLVIILPISFVILAICLWFKYGRDELVVETVEFYPPEGCNSLDVGFLYNGEATNKDVTSLLIYLANKGYLKITNKENSLNSNKVKLNLRKNAMQRAEEIQNKLAELRKNNPQSEEIKYYEDMLKDYKSMANKNFINLAVMYPNPQNEFVITKLKDYDGDNFCEKWFMEGLFNYGNTEVIPEMLYDNFYVTNEVILDYVNKKENKEKIFEKNSTNKNNFLIFLIIIIFCLITIPALQNYGELNMSELMVSLLFPGFGFSIMISMLLDSKKWTMARDGLVFKFLTIAASSLFGVLFGGIPFAQFVLPALLFEPFYLVAYIIGLLSITIIFVCLKYLPKRTKYGRDMLGRLKGFKNFLETVEKEKLEALVEQDPSYFYNILPYTYVLGVSDKWIEKFETINMAPPSWYEGSSSFNFSTFSTFLNTTMVSAQSYMSSSSSSDSDSSSGGGSSGGGSGGGGGSSW